MKYPIVIILSFLVLFRCNLACDLDKERKTMLNDVQEEYNHYCTIEVIPCEGYYLNIHLKKEEVPDITQELHHRLYDTSTKSGWLSLHLYDHNGKFIMTHHINGHRSTKAPRW